MFKEDSKSLSAFIARNCYSIIWFIADLNYIFLKRIVAFLFAFSCVEGAVVGSIF